MPGIEHMSPTSPILAGIFFNTVLPWEAPISGGSDSQIQLSILVPGMARLLPYCLQWSTPCCMTSYEVWQRASFFGNWMAYDFCSILSIIFKPIFSKRNKNIQIEKWPKHVNCETGFSLESGVLGHMAHFTPQIFHSLGTDGHNPW